MRYKIMGSNILFHVNSLSWSLDNLIPHLGNKFQDWITAFITVLAIVIVGFAAWKFFKAVTSQQGQGKYALDGGIALIVAGALFGGWSLFKNIAQGGTDTVKTLGNVVHFAADNIHLLF